MGVSELVNSVTTALISELQNQLPPAVFRSDTQKYLEEPRGRWMGQAGTVLAPGTTEEVAQIIRTAVAARVGVVPYGGGTGLVAGQVMPEGPAPLVLSLERMNVVRAVHIQENVLIAEAGAVLHDVHAAAAQHDRLFPLWLASEGSCQIGGNLSTNAGGVNVIRYGSARDLCLGLEAVLPNGETWNGLKRLRKDNTGYDLRNLLIGAEGTLGVITAAALRLYPRPEKEGAALFVVPDPAAAVGLLNRALGQIGEGVSAFELLSGVGLDFLAQTMPGIRLPFSENPPWCVLIDVGVSGGIDPMAALTDLFEVALQEGFATDGLIASNETQRQDFWRVRESIPAANKNVGSLASHDISLPISAIPEFISKTGAKIRAAGDFRINCFGHLGDGNLHYNLFPALTREWADYAGVGKQLKRIVHDMVAEFDGSFSAEHGVGRMKVGELERYGDPTKLAAMRAIKDALDPLGIMNPGAILSNQ